MEKTTIQELSNFAKTFSKMYNDGKTGVLNFSSHIDYSDDWAAKPSVQLRSERFFEEFSIYKKLPFNDQYEEFRTEVNGVTFTTLKEIESKKTAV